MLDNDIPDSVIEGGNVELIYRENVFSGDAFIDTHLLPTITSFGFHNELASGDAFNNMIIVIHEDTIIEEMEFSKGVYFNKEASDVYVSSFTKEASTQEVVHQIDQKYIPQSSGGAMFVTVVFDDDLVGTADKTLSELATAYESGMNVIATIEAFDMTIAKVTCTQYADGGLRFGMPVRTDDDGFCLVPLEVYDSAGIDVWETHML